MGLLTKAEFAALRAAPLDWLPRVLPLSRGLVPRLVRIRQRKARRLAVRRPYGAGP